MPRKQQRKTDTGTISADVMERAVKQVVEDKHSIRKVCKDTSIAKTTLIRYINKYKNAKEGSQNEVKFMPNYACRRIFSDTEEKMLEEYIVEASRIHYGLTLKMVRRLAYESGLANSRKMPDSWLENEMAGEDWLGSFRKRHQHLSLRQPEATSLSRATSFNHHNVSSFFKNLKNIYDRFKLGPGDIYNVDETGLTTCHNPGKIMAQKGIKQIGKVSSADRGQLVTVCACINALGNSIPPFFIFPRVKFKEYMLHGAPTGSAGCAHSSGWMTSENFIIFLEHFIKYAKCSKQAPILLLLDNHESHVSIPAFNLAKNNGIHMLTFPPHTSHKMQPLDRTVFGPLKSYYNKACDSRMMTCPGKPLTIYDISSLAGIAFPQAMTQKNIQSGFKVTGIWPYNEDIFQDHEFKSSYVTDQPTPVMTDLSTPSYSNNQHQNELDLNTTLIRTPEEVCPFPKAGLRKSTSGSRKCSSRILTDTPVKMILEEEARQKAIKKAIQEANALKKTKKKLKVCFENSSDSDPDEIVDCEEKESSESENYSDHDLTTSEYDTSIKKMKVGSYVLVKFATKRNIVHYVGLILEIIDDDSVQIRFMRRKLNGNQFLFPDTVDESVVDVTDIVMLLPDPKVSQENSRLSATHKYFDISFANLNVR